MLKQVPILFKHVKFVIKKIRCNKRLQLHISRAEFPNLINSFSVNHKLYIFHLQADLFSKETEVLQVKRSQFFIPRFYYTLLGCKHILDQVCLPHVLYFLQIGAFHTLEIELHRPFVLRKVFFNFKFIEQSSSIVYTLIHCAIQING